MRGMGALETLFGEFADAQVFIVRNIARVVPQDVRDSEALAASFASQ